MAESGTYTPETLSRRAKMAEALLADPKQPVTHWAQGLNELLKGAVGGLELHRIEGEEKAGRAGMNEALAALLGGAGAGAGPASPAPAGEPMGDRSITSGPRSASFGPVTTEPPPAQPSPYKLAGMAPLSSQDTHNTPLDVMMPRDKVAAALRTATGAPPPMAGMTPAGATPVPTQSITPPQPSPPVASPAPVAAALSAPVASPRVPVDAGRAKVAAMLASPNPYVQHLGQKLAGSYIKPEEPKYHRLNDELLFEEKTGKTMPAGGGFKALTSPEERAAHGIPASDNRPYQLGPGNKLINPPAETRLTVDQRGESAFQTHAATAQAKRFDELVKHGQDSKALISDINALREIGSRITTGKTAEVKAALGPYAEAMGIKIDQLDDLQAYKAITARLTPRMRVPGSGATSDYEMKTFMQALPGLGATPGGNEIIARTLESLEQHKIAAGEIGSRALAGELSPREAEKELRTLPDPFTLWKKTHGGASSAAPATGAPASGKTSSGVQWSVQ